MTEQAGKAFATLRSADLVNQVGESLVQAIVEGRLAPGQRLVEAELARQMGISRAPLREAARRLEQRGLLVAHPRRGFFVRELSLGEVDDLYAVRIMAESCAARLTAERAGRAGLDELARRIEEMRRLARAGKEAALVEADLQFHRALSVLSGNRRLLRLYDDMAIDVRMVIAMIDHLYDDPLVIAETHTPILEALEGGDPRIITEAVEYHIGVAWTEVRRFFAERPPGGSAREPAADSPAPAPARQS
ncbi:MAG: GntR family transcriptional regulator [Tistlia sp.]|uniref:GntR family transcriptional regulator n=1 Tax=Tistlia sp. TaxID=3057121 RepID=UPI0034A2A6FE